MGVKFFGEPFKEIKSLQTNKVAFRFDSKGEFITEDPDIIERATGKFDHVPVKIEVVGERVAKTFIVPPLTITENQGEESAEEESPGIFCKKCGEGPFENNGYLLAHARKEHPKGAS
jgi:hypothetical protein